MLDNQFDNQFDNHFDDSEDVVVWRPIQYAMASHRRVLVVDDYREAADALQMLLNADGFECRALEDPHAVCEMAGNPLVSHTRNSSQADANCRPDTLGDRESASIRNQSPVTNHD